MAWATWRNRISSSRSRAWVRDSSWWTGLAEVADVQLHVCALDTTQRVESVGVTPVEAAAQLVGVRLVKGCPAACGQAPEARKPGENRRRYRIAWWDHDCDDDRDHHTGPAAPGASGGRPVA